MVETSCFICTRQPLIKKARRYWYLYKNEFFEKISLFLWLVEMKNY
jgi:hypothetical protein